METVVSYKSRFLQFDQSSKTEGCNEANFESRAVACYGTEGATPSCEHDQVIFLSLCVHKATQAKTIFGQDFPHFLELAIQLRW